MNQATTSSPLNGYGTALSREEQGRVKAVCLYNDHYPPTPAPARTPLRITQRDEPWSRTVEFPYNEAGEVAWARDANGTLHRYGHDQMGRLVSDELRRVEWHIDDGASEIEYAYAYDEFGRLDNQHALAQAKGLDQRYGYNRLDLQEELTQGEFVTPGGVILPASTSLSLAGERDASGNWIRLRELNAITGQSMRQRRRHSPTNRIVSVNGDNWAGFEYDAAGNLIRMPQPNDPTRQFTCVYDGWNRLVQIRDGNRPVAAYEYDGLGRRTVARSYDAQGQLLEIRHFYYDQQDRVVVEYLEDDLKFPPVFTKDREYLWGSGGDLAAGVFILRKLLENALFEGEFRLPLVAATELAAGSDRFGDGLDFRKGERLAGDDPGR